MGFAAEVRAEHGAQGVTATDDSNANSNQAFDGASLVMPNARGKASRDPLPAVPAKKPAAKQVYNYIPSRAPLVIFATGVDDIDGRSDDAAVQRSKAMHRAIAIGEPGARVIDIYPLTLKKVAEAWTDLRRRERFVDPPLSALIIVDTAFREPTNTLDVDAVLGTSLGPVRWRDFADALRRLDGTLYPDNFENRQRLQTAVIGSFAGQMDCDSLPGKGFGTTANRGEMEPAQFDAWIRAQKQARYFPLNTFDWYGHWGAGEARASRGFFCDDDRDHSVVGVKAVVRPWLQPTAMNAPR